MTFRYFPWNSGKFTLCFQSQFQWISATPKYQVNLMHYHLFRNVKTTSQNHCVYKANFNDSQHFSSCFIKFSFVFTRYFECFSATSEYLVILMEYLLFSNVKSTSQKHCVYKANSNDFQYFSSFSIKLALFLQGILNAFPQRQNT